jgi:hypothetical protein
MIKAFEVSVILTKKSRFEDVKKKRPKDKWISSGLFL